MSKAEVKKRLTASSKATDFSLFIIESLRFSDEKKGRLEGKILCDLLRLSRRGIKNEYIYIRTWKEFNEALYLFNRSNKRYLHISCHGNEEEIALTLDTIPFEEFGDEIAPFINERRLFFCSSQPVKSRMRNLPEL